MIEKRLALTAMADSVINALGRLRHLRPADRRVRGRLRAGRSRVSVDSRSPGTIVSRETVRMPERPDDHPIGGIDRHRLHPEVGVWGDWIVLGPGCA